MRSLRRLPFQLVLFAVTRPWTTLLTASILCGIGVVLGFRLPNSTDQNKLFSQDVAYFREFVEFQDKFPENETACVVVEPANRSVPSPPTERWTALADDIADRLRKMPKTIKTVEVRVPGEKLRDQGLLFEDSAALPGYVADAKQFLRLVRLFGEGQEDSPAIRRFTDAMILERLLRRTDGQETEPFIAAVAASWDRALADPKLPLKPGQGLPDLEKLGVESPRDLGYFYLPDESDPARKRRVLLIQAYPKENYTSMTYIAEVVEAIRKASTEAAASYPEFRVAVTGRPALEADEMRTSDTDATRAETVAMSAVFVGMLLFLRSFRLAVSAVISLLAGISLTYIWTTFTVGELNLLSLVFLIALIAIGMDYFVQVLSRYRVESRRRAGVRTTWIAVFHQVAAPIITACCGAAGAFGVAVLTHFKGAADLGVIAGGGLLLCLLCGFTVLPAILTVTRKRAATVRMTSRVPQVDGTPETCATNDPALVSEYREPWHPQNQANRTTGRGRMLILPAAFVLILATLVPYALKSTFDADLLGLQAPNLESVQQIRKLQAWSAVVLSKDLTTLRRARDAVAGSAEVKGTESILSAYDNLAWLKKNADELQKVEWADPKPMQAADLAPLAEKLRSLAAQLPPRKGSEPTASNPSASKHLRAAADRLKSETDAGKADLAARRLTEWQTAFTSELRTLLARFKPNDVRINELPPELKNHLVAADGTYALYLYPKRDLWQRENLVSFVAEVESRLASATGVPAPTGIAINILHSTDRVKESFILATGYALGLILLLVVVDLRSLRQTLLAVSVLALGLPMLMGLMSLLDVRWNLANYFGLPILIGAGHEYGVFMVHRYREAVHQPIRRAWRGWDASDWGLLLCAYITSASFGFFWLIAHHRGLKSLGLVMALGTTCIYLAAVAVLRPVLKWRLRARSRVSP